MDSNPHLDLATFEIALHYGPRDPQKHYNPDAWSIYICDPATQTTSLHRLAYTSRDRFGNEWHPAVEARYDTHPGEMKRYKEREFLGWVAEGKTVARVRSEIARVGVGRRDSHDWVKEVVRVLREKELIVVRWKGRMWLDNN
ncbi:MAG: hypothetical protein Q9176_007386 [Flavoplaca citrina]